MNEAQPIAARMDDAAPLLALVRYENKLIDGPAGEINEQLKRENAEGWTADSFAIHGHNHVFALLSRMVDAEELPPADCGAGADVASGDDEGEKRSAAA